MHFLIALGGFAAGVLTARGGPGRSLVKGVIRAGYTINRSLQATLEEVREEVSDIAAEARYEVDANRPKPATAPPVKPTV